MDDSQKVNADRYLAPETLAQIAPFEMRAKMIVEGVMNGMHRSPFKGLAVEFAEHRQYAPGDEIRHLDWKVYGRTDKLYLKQYQQETNLDTILLVDSSGSMGYGSLESKKGWGGTAAGSRVSRWTKYDHATAVSAALSHLCLQQRDRIGAGIFSDGLHTDIRRSNRREQWRAIIKTLGSHDTKGATNYIRVADQAVSKTDNRSLFFMISDFLCDHGELKEMLSRFKHHGHDLVLVQVLDRTELTFDLDTPAPFIGMEGEDRVNVDPRSLRSTYLEVLREQLEGTRDMVRAYGFDHQLLDTHDSIGPPLARLLARRESHVGKRGG